MIKDRTKPRLTVEITTYQCNQLRKYLEYGMQKRVFSIIVDDVIRMLQEYGGHFIVAMMQKEITYKRMMEAYAGAIGIAPREQEEPSDGET